MIQRVQTIWMILAAIAVFLTLKFSFYSGTLAVDNSYHALMATDNFFLRFFAGNIFIAKVNKH